MNNAEKPQLTIPRVMYRFSYRWTLKDANFTKDKGKVFSCFACLLAYYLYICGI